MLPLFAFGLIWVFAGLAALHLIPGEDVRFDVFQGIFFLALGFGHFALLARGVRAFPDE